MVQLVCQAANNELLHRLPQAACTPRKVVRFLSQGIACRASSAAVKLCKERSAAAAMAIAVLWAMAGAGRRLRRCQHHRDISFQQSCHCVQDASLEPRHHIYLTLRAVPACTGSLPQLVYQK